MTTAEYVTKKGRRVGGLLKKQKGASVNLG